MHPGTRMVPGGQVAVPVQLMQQVQEIFPHLPLRVIAEDLSHTMSVEASVVHHHHHRHLIIVISSSS